MQATITRMLEPMEKIPTPPYTWTFPPGEGTTCKYISTINLSYYCNVCWLRALEPVATLPTDVLHRQFVFLNLPAHLYILHIFIFIFIHLIQAFDMCVERIIGSTKTRMNNGGWYIPGIGACGHYKLIVGLVSPSWDTRVLVRATLLLLILLLLLVHARREQEINEYGELGNQLAPYWGVDRRWRDWSRRGETRRPKDAKLT